MLSCLISSLILGFSVVLAQECLPQKFKEGSIVCKCNSTHCDFLQIPKATSDGQFIDVSSDKNGKRFFVQSGTVTTDEDDGVIINVDSAIKYQKIVGFGGAFTDSAGLNIRKLSRGTQENLMRSYFDVEKGINYNIGRVPIAGTDFSTRGYTYDDVPGDVELKNFNLTQEDHSYKIPLMLSAKEMNPAMKFMAAAWTAPPWMKTNNAYNGLGWLKKEYYQAFADYVVKFLEDYKNQGLNIDWVSTGNEPSTALLPVSFINKMLWTPGWTAKWINENLYPALQKSESNETKIVGNDDQRYTLPSYVAELKVFHNDAMNKIDMIGVHWYWDSFIPARVLDITHSLIPDKPIVITEACIDRLPWSFPAVKLGSWKRAERLIFKMFENFQHWISGWIDWNLALDKFGGPNWVQNTVDAPIIVVPEEDTFYKQPYFYVMGHFSKFLPPESVRIKIKSDDSSILSLAFITPEGNNVIILYNKNEKERKISIHDYKVGNLHLLLDPLSLHTIVY